MNSLTLYNDACDFIRQYPNAKDLQKKFYMQILTTIFYELLTKKTSPLLSKFCTDKGIRTFSTKNFKILPTTPNYSIQNSSSVDMYLTLYGLSITFSKSLEACSELYDKELFTNNIFRGQILSDSYTKSLYDFLQTIDDCMKNFQPIEKKVAVPVEKVIEKPAVTQMVSDTESTNLLKALDEIAQNRKSDDEKIVGEIKKVQQTMQDELSAIQQSLKQVAEIRDGIDFRSMKEPIYQLIQLYHKLDDNLKRHPMADKEKGYASLIKRCESFLKYVTQSLKMLGVELIDETGGKFNPDRNKIADDAPVSLNSTVTKIVKVGFAYKGQILEKAEVISN